MPTRTTLPSRTPALLTLWPSMRMPLVEPRSLASIRRSRDPDALGRYLDEYVVGVRDRAEYVERCGGLERLRAKERMCAGVNYGY